MFDDVLQDVRYALRALSSSPGFSAIAILSLALGIGANTAIFSLINAVILKTLPVSHPEQLVELGMKTEDGLSFTNPVWEQVRDHQDVFSGAFAYSPTRLNLAMGGEVRNANASWVSGAFFRTLGVNPLLGRTIADNDDKRGCPVIGLLSYDFWQREFGGAADVLDRRLTLNTHPVRIVGVAPPGFSGIQVGEAVDVYLPLCAEGTVIRENSALDKRNNSWLWIFARLRPGISRQQALARMNTLAPQIFADSLPANFPPDAQKRYLAQKFNLLQGAKGFSNVRHDYKAALYTLMAAVVMVLLIACANVANLLISRAAVRRKEVAIRMAIGASRARLIRQLLTESVLLSSIGAILGVVFAQWASRVLVHFLSTSNATVVLDLSIDIRVLAFTTAVAIATGILFGLAPAWHGTRVDPNLAMKANARGVVESQAGFSLGKMLVASQVALSLVLLIGAGLMLKTFAKLATLDTGFDKKQVLLIRVDPRYASVLPERRLSLYQELQRRLAAVPGVRSASFADITPVSGSSSYQVIHVNGYMGKSAEDSMVWINSISAGFFATMETPFIAGRDFDAHDTLQAPLVAVVNESMANKFFGSPRQAVGKTFRPGGNGGSPIQIVGVVKDTKYRSLRAEGEAIAYYPLSQLPPMRWANFVLRANGPATSLIAGVKAAVDEVNHDITLQFRTLSVQLDESLGRERLLATLSGFFGALALALAVIGLYGVMSYNVARRRNEIGIRMALGAERARVLRMVLGEVAILLLVGLVLGWVVSVFSTRLLASFLYRLEPTDPTTLVTACVVLAVSAVVAGLLPARRAANLDPMTALREE
ncbi:MAG TPA: ABC transporter permease [Candidatus Limnocylindrales bacterium]|nr:ABC transporter permease [Candidatus Limnocylindrales bacterium]